MKLKIGDRIRITGLPSYIKNNPEFCCPKETKIVWNKLAARKRPVVINKIDEWGTPWYECRIWNVRYKRWERHFLSVGRDEDNWVLVKRRK